MDARLLPRLDVRKSKLQVRGTELVQNYEVVCQQRTPSRRSAFAGALFTLCCSWHGGLVSTTTPPRLSLPSQKRTDDNIICDLPSKHRFRWCLLPNADVSVPTLSGSSLPLLGPIRAQGTATSRLEGARSGIATRFADTQGNTPRGETAAGKREKQL